MSTSLCKKLIFFGWAAITLSSIATAILNFFMASMSLNIYSVLNLIITSISGLLILEIISCHVMLYLADRDIIDLAIGVLMAVGIVASSVISVLAGGYGVNIELVNIVSGIIGGAYILPWAFREKDRNPLVMILLGCTFLWSVFGAFALNVLIDSLEVDFLTAMSNIFVIACSGIRAFAAFLDMNE